MISTHLLTFKNKTLYDVYCQDHHHDSFLKKEEYVIRKSGDMYMVNNKTKEIFERFDKFLDAINYLENQLRVKWDNQESDMPIAAVSTKTYGDEKGFPVAYRQWRAESHCNVNHGYNLKFHFEFECCDLDVRNWCVDYGGLKNLKDILDDWFDHKTLVATDDPKKEAFEKLAEEGLASITYVEATGCEALAKFLWEYMEEIWLPDNGYSPRVRMRRVEVRETAANMAYIDRSCY